MIRWATIMDWLSPTKQNLECTENSQWDLMKHNTNLVPTGQSWMPQADISPQLPLLSWSSCHPWHIATQWLGNVRPLRVHTGSYPVSVQWGHDGAEWRKATMTTYTITYTQQSTLLSMQTHTCTLMRTYHVVIWLKVAQLNIYSLYNDNNHITTLAEHIQLVQW